MDADRHLTGVAMALFQPHVILPAQLFSPPKEFTPEHRLRAAILADAVWCVEKYRFPTDARGRRLFRRAKQWLLASEPHWPYSFENICAVLDLNANAVRHRLRLTGEQPPVAVSREMQPTRLEHGILASVKSDTLVSSAAGIRSHTSPKRSSRTANPTRRAMRIPRITMRKLNDGRSA
jgi:hypothetical protein